MLLAGCWWLLQLLLPPPAVVPAPPIMVRSPQRHNRAPTIITISLPPSQKLRFAITSTVPLSVLPQCPSACIRRSEKLSGFFFFSAVALNVLPPCSSVCTRRTRNPSCFFFFSSLFPSLRTKPSLFSSPSCLSCALSHDVTQHLCACDTIGNC